MIKNPEQIISERYENLVYLQSGSASRVYKAWDSKEKRFIAVKIGKKEEFGSHIKKDFEILSDLNHPNLCRVYSMDFYGKEGLVIQYLEYIDGINILEACTPLDFPFLTRRLKEILLALDYIHSKSLVHMDIKINNIMVENAERENDPKVKILDFGISKRITDIRDSRISGTIHYIAPEQFLSGRITHKADLFSLGVLLYRITTSRFPFEGKSINQVMESILNSTPVLPYVLNPDIPYYLNLIIENLLSKDPGQRFDSAAEILDIINSYSESYDKHFSYAGKILHPPPFAGRDGLIRSVQDTVESYFSGKESCNFLMLIGERGIGKTAVLRKINNALLLRDITSQMYTPRKDSKIPYEMLIDLLTLFMDTSLGYGYKSDIKRIFREYEAEIKANLFLNKDRIFSSIAGFFEIVDSSARAVFLIDDFEFTDSSSIELLNNLLLSIAPRRNFLFIVSVDESEYPVVSEVLSFPVKAFNITTLGKSETLKILEGMSGMHDLPEAIKDYILENSGGNPTFIVELFRHIWPSYLKNLSIEHVFDREASVTARFRQIFIKKISRLNSDETALLKYTSLFNLPFRLSTICELLEGIIDNVPALIDGLINKDILEYMQGDVYIRSKRAIYNTLIREKLDKNTIRAIHKRIALFYERKKPDYPGLPDEEIAYHFIEAQDAEKLEYVLFVVDQVFKKGSLGQAVSMLEQVLEYADTNNPLFDDILDKYFQCQYYSGNYSKLLCFLSEKESKTDPGSKTGIQIRLYQARIHTELRSYTKAFGILDELGGMKQLVNYPEQRYEYLLLSFIMTFKYRSDLNAGDKQLSEIACTMEKKDMPENLRAEYKMALANYWYIVRHDYGRALEYWEDAYSYFKRVNDLYGLSRTTNNLSLKYLNDGNYEKALKFMNESADYDRTLGNLPSLGKTYGNMGVIYQHKMEFGKSLRYYLESLKIREKLHLSEVYKIYNNIIYVYYLLNRYQSALELIKKIENDVSIDDKQEFYNTHMSKAKCLMDIGDYEGSMAIVNFLRKELGESNVEMLMVGMKNQFYLSDDPGFSKARKQLEEILIKDGEGLESHTNSIYSMLEFFSENGLLDPAGELKKRYLKLKITKNTASFKVNILYCLSYLEKDSYICLEYLSNAIRTEKKIGRPLYLFRLFYRRGELLTALGQKEAGMEQIKMAGYYFRQFENNIPEKFTSFFHKSPAYNKYRDMYNSL